MQQKVQSSVGIVEIIVSTEHTAVLDGREIHPVYSTFWLAYHAELAARRAIEPYFDEGENAVGGQIDVRHIAMAAVGDTVTIRAEVTEVSGAKIVCSITACTPTRTIATGRQVQIVMPQERIDALVREAYALAGNSSYLAKY